MFRPSTPKVKTVEGSLQRMSELMNDITHELKDYSESSSCFNTDRHTKIANINTLLKPILIEANDIKETNEKKAAAFTKAIETLKDSFVAIIPGIPFDEIRTTTKSWGYNNDKIKTLFEKCKLKEEAFENEMFSIRLSLSDKVIVNTAARKSQL